MRETRKVKMTCFFSFSLCADQEVLHKVNDTRFNIQGRPGGVVVYQYTRKKFAKIPKIHSNFPKLVEALYWFIYIARYVFKSPSICF